MSGKRKHKKPKTLKAEPASTPTNREASPNSAEPQPVQDAESQPAEQFKNQHIAEAPGDQHEQAVKAAPTPKEELEELKQRWQRLAADYQNYQKRSYRQIGEAAQFARETMVKALLSVLDNFEHTLAKGTESQDISTVIQGVQIVYDDLFSVLEGFGMRRIDVHTGDPFDPNYHEAVLHDQTDQHAANSVLRELARGYTMNDHTLRPAKVSVAKPPTPAAHEEIEKSEQPDSTNQANNTEQS